MPLDNSLYSLIGQPDPSVGKIAASFDPTVIQARQLDDQTKRNALQDLLDTQKARDVYSKMTPDMNLHDVATQLYQAGAIKPAMDARNAAIAQDKAKLDAQKTQAEIGQANSKAGLNTADTAAKNIEVSRNHLAALVSGGLPIGDDDMIAMAKLHGLPDEKVPAFVAALPQDPEVRKKWAVDQIRTPDQIVTQNTAKPVIVNAGGNQVPGVQNPVTGQITPAGAPIAVTPTGSAQLSADTSVRNNNATNATRLQVAGMGGAGGKGGPASGLTPDAIENAATKYRQTGALPPAGRGAIGAAMNIKIQNRAAEQAKEAGSDSESQTIAQAAYKSAAAALSALTKQQTMVGSFEKTAQANLDLALQLSDKVDRTGSPMLNKGLLAFKNHVQGDADTASFVNALTAARTEYAKVLSGSTGATGVTDSARKEADELFNSATSKETLRQVLATARQEMANRTKAFDDQKAELTKGMRLPSGATSAPPANRPPLSSFHK